jgi:hypothetical protein
MKIYIDYDMANRCWSYYYYDTQGYKTTTSGFDNHLLAKEHAVDIHGIDIEFVI